MLLSYKLKCNNAIAAIKKRCFIYAIRIKEKARRGKYYFMELEAY